MLTSFEEMPATSRLWIYQAERVLDEKEVALVENATSTFLSQWQAHGQSLKSSFKIAYDQFLIITVDEGAANATGCSIDASVHLIQSLESALKLSFMNNNLVAFLINDKVALFPFNKLKEEVATKTIEPTTPVFNNTVQSLGDFRDKWLIASKESWVKRYFN